MKAGEKFLRREPEKFLAVGYGYLLTGIAFKMKGDGWRMTLCIRNEKNQNVVTFIEGNTVYDCWAYLYNDLTNKRTPLRWYTNRFQ